MPVPTMLIQQLQQVKERRNALPTHLVFPNSKGKPNRGMDMIVKRVAERAKLNCGQCLTKHGNKCSEGPYCQHYFLNKFRNTFATLHLREGVDIRTLQIWMGHRDIKSTLSYLESAQPKNAWEQVNGNAVATYCNTVPNRSAVGGKQDENTQSDQL